MTQSNYESQWWGYIYDQMMMQDLPDQLEKTRYFYHSLIKTDAEPILECACGSGLIFLSLLGADLDIHGFDISVPMLDQLRRNAEQQGFNDIENRLSVQNLISFRYPHKFQTIIIPSNTFSMLSTQADQILALQNIYAHLESNGRLLLDLNLASVRELGSSQESQQGRWHTWIHPETGRTIRQRIVGTLDFDNQLVIDRCYIEYDDQRNEFPMIARWIFREEFQLLLQMAGFTHWHCFGTPEQAPLVLGPEGAQSYWIVHKN